MSKTMKNIPKLRFLEFQNDGAWEEKPLSELLTIGNGRDYKHLSKGEIPVYGTGGYMLSVNDYLYDGESVCIGRKGTIDRPMFLTGKFWTVDTLFYTHSFKNCIPKYIFYNFGTINWYNYNEAGGVPSLSKATINKINIPVPPKDNTKEQQKIAECLSSLDALILAHSSKVEALKAHKKALMQQLFPAEGETTPRLRFPEFQNAPEWEGKRLGDVGEVLQGYGFPERLQGKTQGKYPFYKVSDISNAVQSGNNFINLSNNYIGDDTLIELKAKLIPRGVTIFAKIGEAIRSNRRVITTQVCLVDNNTAGIKAIKERATDLFIFYTMSKIDLIEYCAGVVPSINKTALENIQIFCPPTTIEQQKIADSLSSIDELTTSQIAKVEALKQHKKALMQQLFPKSEDK